MKQKLFLIATLILSSFAFVSCDEVIDNPAINSEASSQQWAYEVSVKFADFDFTAAPGGPYAYKAPQKLYVYNEAGTELGTLTTADEMDDLTKFYKFAGTLEGTFGENLIISTIKAADYAKQDGTLKSIIDNNVILQATKVAVRNYSTAASVVYTANATLENKTAIIRINKWQFKGGDNIRFASSDTQPSEWTVNEEFDPSTATTDLYAAIPTNGDSEAEYDITTNSVDGFTRGATLNSDILPSPLVPGEVTPYLLGFGMEELGVDLTIYDAYKRKTETWDWGYQYLIDHGYIPTLSKRVENGKKFFITQSGAKLDSLDVNIGAKPGDEVEITIDNVRLGEESGLELGSTNNWYANDGTYDLYGWSGKVNLTLTGDNKFGYLKMYCPYALKSPENWAFNRLIVGTYGHKSSMDDQYVIDGSLTYTLNKGIEGLQTINPQGGIVNINTDIEIPFIWISEKGTVNIADGVTVNIKNEEEEGNAYLNVRENSTLKIGKGSTLNVTNKLTGNFVVNVDESTIEFADGTSTENGVKFTANGPKNSTVLQLNKATWKIGKFAKVDITADATRGKTGSGMYIAGSNVNVGENANVTIKSIDEYAMQVSSYWDWDPTTSTSTNLPTNITIAKDASLNLDAAEEGPGVSLQWGAMLTIDGKGTFTAKSEERNGILISGSSKLTFKGGTSVITGGKNKPAISLNSNNPDVLTIEKTITSFKAISGMTSSPICILDEATDAEITKALIGTADADKFIDTTAEGVRTITPKPAAE